MTAHVLHNGFARLQVEQSLILTQLEEEGYDDAYRKLRRLHGSRLVRQKALSVALQAADSDEVEMSGVAHTPETIHAWVAQLRQRFESQKVALCTEQKQGALIYALCQYDFIVLFPVNPQTVAK